MCPGVHILDQAVLELRNPLTLLPGGGIKGKGYNFLATLILLNSKNKTLKLKKKKLQKH
jgi:hypothetical protein